MPHVPFFCQPTNTNQSAARLYGDVIFMEESNWSVGESDEAPLKKARGVFFEKNTPGDFFREPTTALA